MTEGWEQSVRELAKQVEYWIASLRYDLKDERVQISHFYEMSQFNLPNVVGAYASLGGDPIGNIKKAILHINELGYETPEEIKNRTTLVEAFGKTISKPKSNCRCCSRKKIIE